MTNRDDQQNQPAGEAPLQSWKEIADYLERDIRTAQRWEESGGLPVRRHGGSAGSVYAYPSEIQSWRASRETKPGGEAALTSAREQPRRLLIPTLAIAGAVGGALLVIGFGPVLNPPSPIAQAAGDGVRTELVWPQAKGISPEGSVSPDGKFVTYVDWFDGGNLAIRNLETGENRRLTQTADNGSVFANNSRISAAGDRVAYSWFLGSPDAATTELRLMSLGDYTEQPRTIWSPGDGSHASVQDWFPDGDRVLAIVQKSSDHQIVTVSVTDGDVRQIRSIAWTDDPRARISPDGRYIAYSRSASRDEPAKDIYVVAVDGSSEAAIVQHAANDELVGWSPKGDYLVINSDRGGQPGLWIQPLEDAAPVGQLQLIVPNVDVAAGMGLTKDGSLYYSVRVSQQRLKLAEIDLQTGKFLAEPKNAVERFVGHNSRGTFSPDGEEFAYLSEREGRRNRAIVVRTLATGEERIVPHDLKYVLGMFWPTGGHSLIVGGRDDRDRYGQFSLTNGHADLILQGGNRDLSPDGARLLYRSRQPEDRSIFSYRLADGSVERVPGDFGTGQFSALADGRIATIRNRTEILLHPAAGGEGKILWRTDEDHQFGRQVARTPDGKALVVLRRDSDTGADTSAGMWRFWVVPVDGEPPYPTELLHERYGRVNIHPDGKHILYAHGGSFFQMWAMRNLPFDLQERARQ